MSEQDNNTAGAGNNGAQQGANERTFTQADVDRVVQERLAREREKYADHEDLQRKAAELDEIKASQQSELEKVTARAEAAEKKAAEAVAAQKAAEVQALRVRIATEKGVPAKLAKYITGETQEEIEAAAEDLANPAGDPGTLPGHVPSAGTGGSTPDRAGDAAERAKAWAGRN